MSMLTFPSFHNARGFFKTPSFGVSVPAPYTRYTWKLQVQRGNGRLVECEGFTVVNH